MIAKRKRLAGTDTTAPGSIQRRAFLRRTSPLRRSKFGNTRQHIAGQSFASGLEARVYASLMLLEKAGQIRGLRREVTHQLYAAGTWAGCACQMFSDVSVPPDAIRIYAPRLDFQFEERKQPAPTWSGGKLAHGDQWKLIYADAKGFQDDKQRMGYKLFAAIHGQEIRLYRKGDLS